MWKFYFILLYLTGLLPFWLTFIFISIFFQGVTSCLGACLFAFFETDACDWVERLMRRIWEKLGKNKSLIKTYCMEHILINIPTEILVLCRLFPLFSSRCFSVCYSVMCFDLWKCKVSAQIPLFHNLFFWVCSYLHFLFYNQMLISLIVFPIAFLVSILFGANSIIFLPFS